MQAIKQAADKGDARAQVLYGVIFTLGPDESRDYHRALKYFRMSARKGDAWGLNQVGLMYSRGSGVTVDHKESCNWFRKGARQWLKKAIDHEDTWGYYNLGFLHHSGLRRGVNFSMARENYRLAAAEGNHLAMYQLGRLNMGGHGGGGLTRNSLLLNGSQKLLHVGISNRN